MEKATGQEMDKSATIEMEVAHELLLFHGVDYDAV